MTAGHPKFRLRLHLCWWLLVVVLGWLATSTELLASQSVELTWSRSTSAQIVAYKVYYGTESGVYPNTITFGNISDVIIPGLADGATYYFAVSAINANNYESDPSGETTYVVPGAGPISMQVQGSTAGLGAVAVSWTPSTESDVSGYTVSYGTQSGVYDNSATFYSTTSGIIAGLTGGVTYYFSVSPVDSLGAQAVASAEVSYVVPIPQPIVLQARPAVGSSGVNLTWNGWQGGGLLGYYIFYGTQSGVYDYSLNCGNVSQLLVTGLAGGQTYYFEIVPEDTYGNEGEPSSEASSQASVPAAVRAQVRGAATAIGAANVSWTASPDSSVYGYEVYYWLDGTSATNSVEFDSATNGVISGLEGGATFDFAVAPLGAAGVAGDLSTVVAYAVPTVPPIVLHARAIPNSPAVELNWNSIPNEGIQGYYVDYGTQSGSYGYGGGYGAVNDLVIPNLSLGQTYYFVVYGVDGYGNETPMSNEAVATTAPAGAIFLQTHVLMGEDGRPDHLEINTPSVVSGPWELDSSTDLKNWAAFASGTGPGNGDGHDVDVNIQMNSVARGMFFRLRQ